MNLKAMFNSSAILSVVFELFMVAYARPFGTGDLYGEVRGVQAHRGGAGMRPESIFVNLSQVLVQILTMDRHSLRLWLRARNWSGCA